MKAVLTKVWRLTIGPVYFRLFRRYYDAELRELRRLHERLDTLDAHLHSLLGVRWETEALARRMAMLEERVGAGGATHVLESGVPEAGPIPGAPEADPTPSATVGQSER